MWRPSRPRRRTLIIVGVLVALLAVPTWSLGSTLIKPSTDPLSARVVEWARDHHMGGLVNDIEQTWYEHHQPKVGGVPKGGIPTVPQIQTTTPPVSPTTSSPTPTSQPLPFRPTPVPPLVATPLPGEGVWQPAGRLVDGKPALWVTYMRPDAVHTSLLIGLAYLNMQHLTATLHAGTSLPGDGPWVQPPRVDPSQYPYAVAAFNSGFRLDANHGGYYAEGRTVKPLAQGAASFIIYRDGHANVGVWGRDAQMGPTISSVRQNLTLLVDGGQLNPAINTADFQQWGGTEGKKIYVWRSGVGIDKAGNLIYVGGPGLNVATLAELLQRAGAQRAMELDINTDWVTFTMFVPGPTGTLTPAKLLPSMVRPAHRYLETGTRDFFEIDVRH